ncbi:uncharacterized protein LOC114297954 [Camellia sinensis]|uniref:uncharacterized protein LOC114297954 n=1 Tax=Camellia sinensis TaxID=4442 RepID=UPI0010355A5F|nr:uncharacterized protein LOC114297954 [Camellia sinensis]
MIVTRSSNQGNFQYDPKIERTLRRLRKEARRNFEKNNLALDSLFAIYSEEEEVIAGEDPHKHLKKLHVVCTSIKPTGVTEEQIKLRAFPFSLKDSAKDWLYYLPSRTITTWNEMKRLFLEKYFPASRAANIQKEIYGVRQHNRESLHEYWERFKKLCASCPHHQISEQLLIQYFYEGLLPTDRSMIDAASGGALVDKTLEVVRNLIANMAANSQQFGTRLNLPSKHVNEVNISSLE